MESVVETHASADLDNVISGLELLTPTRQTAAQLSARPRIFQLMRTTVRAPAQS